MNADVHPRYILTGERIVAQQRERVRRWPQASHICAPALDMLTLFEQIMANAYALEYTYAGVASSKLLVETPVPAHSDIPHDAIFLGAIDDARFYKYGGAVWRLDQHTWRGVCLVDQWPHRAEARTIAPCASVVRIVPESTP